MNRVFGILGGDNRNIKLSNLLAKENDIVYTYGLEEAEVLENPVNIIKCNDIKEFVSKTNYIIGPIPFSKDCNYINMPYCKQKLMMQEGLQEMKNKLLIVGQVSSKVRKMAKENECEIVDIMQNEELVIFNTIATAEGTIQVLMENTDTVLQDLSVLILGFGKVAKTLAKKLDAIDMKVTCSARKLSDLAWIESYGYTSKDIYKINAELPQYDVIINTIPSLILGKESLSYVNQNTLIIDLASYPGGIDWEEAKKRKIKAICALGLPGRVAPETSARFIKRTVENILKEKSIITN